MYRWAFSTYKVTVYFSLLTCYQNYSKLFTTETKCKVFLILIPNPNIVPPQLLYELKERADLSFEGNWWFMITVCLHKIITVQ